MWLMDPGEGASDSTLEDVLKFRTGMAVGQFTQTDAKHKTSKDPNVNDGPWISRLEQETSLSTILNGYLKQTTETRILHVNDAFRT